MSEEPKETVLLVVDDEVETGNALSKAYKDTNIEVISCSSYNEASQALAQRPCDVIIVAIGNFDERYLELLNSYKVTHPQSFFYLLVDEGYEVVDLAPEDVKHLLEDYLYKPLNASRLKVKIDLALGKTKGESRSLQLVDPIVRQAKPYFIFRSEAMRNALAHLPEIARSDQNVLIIGETGSGKEIVARAIHSLSRRSEGPFVPVNCGAIPESLIEGELFGHEKGAFTGALKTRKGKFELAHGGTLFLDEIGDMALHLQVRLLRVLEDRMVCRIGGDSLIPVDVRVIAATNTDLYRAVEDRLFREDLLYRLDILRINIPPLRDRVEDISLLARHFFERALSEMGRRPPYPEFSPETVRLLEGLPWRGNVRELRNVMTRVATMLPHKNTRVFPYDILRQIDYRPGGELGRKCHVIEGSEYYTIPINATLKEAEELLIQKALERTRGNKSEAAKMLGLSLRTLRRRCNTVAKI